MSTRESNPLYSIRFYRLVYSLQGTESHSGGERTAETTVTLTSSSSPSSYSTRSFYPLHSKSISYSKDTTCDGVSPLTDLAPDVDVLL
jgi:hypothetical protein